MNEKQPYLLEFLKKHESYPIFRECFDLIKGEFLECPSAYGTSYDLIELQGTCSLPTEFVLKNFEDMTGSSLKEALKQWFSDDDGSDIVQFDVEINPLGTNVIRPNKSNGIAYYGYPLLDLYSKVAYVGALYEWWASKKIIKKKERKDMIEVPMLYATINDVNINMLNHSEVLDAALKGNQRNGVFVGRIKVPADKLIGLSECLIGYKTMDTFTDADHFMIEVVDTNDVNIQPVFTDGKEHETYTFKVVEGKCCLFQDYLKYWYGSNVAKFNAFKRFNDNLRNFHKKGEENE